MKCKDDRIEGTINAGGNSQRESGSCEIACQGTGEMMCKGQPVAQSPRGKLSNAQAGKAQGQPVSGATLGDARGADKAPLQGSWQLLSWLSPQVSGVRCPGAALGGKPGVQHMVLKGHGGVQRNRGQLGTHRYFFQKVSNVYEGLSLTLDDRSNHRHSAGRSLAFLPIRHS